MVKRGPNFFIVGAPKCGTTAVYTYLSSHPDVFFPEEVKEPHYYNTDMPGFRWYTSQSTYSALYASSEAQSAGIRGDASVQYLYSQDAAANIYQDNPDSKILVCLRSPVPFIRSYHNQMLNNLDEELVDLRHAWVASTRLRNVAREPRMLNYMSVGHFSEQIARYREFFPDNQIRIMTLEDFTANPRGHYLAILGWLGLTDDGRTEFTRVHGAVATRSTRLSAFLKSPPGWVGAFSTRLKRATGLSSFGLARFLSRLNKVKGYSNANVTSGLADEIEAHYAADQLSLEEHQSLWLVKGS